MPGPSAASYQLASPADRPDGEQPPLPGLGPAAPNPAERSRGRLPDTDPLAVIDIGSNSVRLVVYEALTRAPTPLVNEKALCGLGKALASSGRLDGEAVEHALAALVRFRAVVDQLGVRRLHVLATAAARDASNGADFLARAERICRVPVELVSGELEARLSAYGIVSGIRHPDGLAGDLGGGSLEIVDISGTEIGSGGSVPLGGLRLVDAAGKSLKKAEKIVRDALDTLDLAAGSGRDFYAVGGTWRALARLHMRLHDYPLKVTHGYTLDAAEAIAFARAVQKPTPAMTDAIEALASERRPLLAYGALVLQETVRTAGSARVVMSALGLREGLLYSLLGPADRARDPLLTASGELSLLRSRSPLHDRELIEWTDRLFAVLDPEETGEERRLRHAACLLADIGWRTHPDYRGEQSLNIVAHAAFVAIDHPGRAFLALAVFFRHTGQGEGEPSERLLGLLDARALKRARLVGSALRLADAVCASAHGILPRTTIGTARGRLSLTLPDDVAGLASERLANRVKNLSRIASAAEAP